MAELTEQLKKSRVNERMFFQASGKRLKRRTNNTKDLQKKGGGKKIARKFVPYSIGDGEIVSFKPLKRESKQISQLLSNGLSTKLSYRNSFPRTVNTA